LPTTAYRQRLDTAELFSLRPNFSDDLAELFFQELATLPTFSLDTMDSSLSWGGATMSGVKGEEGWRNGPI
jgi:hypothetical protein